MSNAREGYLSDRAVASLAAPNPLREILLPAMPRFHDLEEPVINLGLAQNDLMQKELLEKIRQCLDFQEADLSYGDPHGSKKLRGLVASMMNRHFKPRVPVELEHVIVTTGSGAAVFHLTMAITDPGDSVFVMAPYYGNFDADVVVHTGVDIVPVYPSHDDDIDLTVHDDVLEAAWQRAADQGKKVKAFLITNPHNPLGRCFSRASLETLLRFCARHQLHVMSDEVYGLSVFPSSETPFVSLLGLPDLDRLIDPSLVHVIYGLSKDFCLNGLRVGFIVNQQNEKLREALKLSALFSYTPSLTDRLLCNILSDEAWVDSFFATNQRRLEAQYRVVTELLEQHDIRYVHAHGGHFLFLDARSFLRYSITIEDEKRIWKALLDGGVYVTPGHVFHTRSFGYFRLTFSQRKEKLEKGLQKLIDVLENRKHPQRNA